LVELTDLLATGAARDVSPSLKQIIGNSGISFEQFLRQNSKLFYPVVMVFAATANTSKAVLQSISREYPSQFTVHATSRDISKVNLPGVTLHQFDFEQKDKLPELLKGVDYVYFTAPSGPMENRCEIVRPVIDAAKAAGVKHVVLLSVAGAEYEGITLTKQFRPLEKHLEASGLNWTIVRPNAFMDNIFGSADQIRKQGVYAQTLKNAAVSVISIVDIAKVVGKIFSNPTPHVKKHYTLTGPESLTGQQQCDIITKVLTKEVKYVDLDPEHLRQYLTGAGMPQWLANGMVELCAEVLAKNMGSGISPDVKNILGHSGTTYADFILSIAPALK